MEKSNSHILIILLFFYTASLGDIHAQSADFEGEVKVQTMTTDNENNNLVVRQADGTLAQRAASTLSGLTVSLTGDTLFQGAGGYIIIPGISAANTVRYRATFDAIWSAATHPVDFPSDPHFSGLIGMTHSSSVELFTPGTLATTGIKNVAEFGSNGALSGEITDLINGDLAQTLILGGGIGNSPGSVSVEFDLTNSHPLVSLVSMIAPSPDWVIATRNVSLIENGGWVESKVVQVAVYDSGTDSGTTFTSNNLPTNPPVPIFLITTPPLGDGTTVANMGTMTFERIDN